MPRLHPAQSRVNHEAGRFNVLCNGRRWGKTKYAITRAQRITLAGKAYGFFSPTYRMLSEVWREYLRRMAPVIREKSVQEKRIELITGGTIDFWSLDNADSPRGKHYDEIGVDEAALIPTVRQTYQAVLRPMLMDRRGSAWFYSTPRGFDEFHEMWELGQSGDGLWRSWQFPTSSNPWIPPDEIEIARGDTDPVVFEQEYNAQFKHRSGLVYFQFARSGNLDESVKDIDDESPIRIGMDFNVNPMSAVVWVKAVDEMHILDTISLNNSGTEEMAAEIRKRWPRRDVHVYPDPSGHARKTSAPVGQTDFTILRKHGFRVIAPNSAPPVVDRVNAVNRLLCDAKGRRRLLVHPRCKPLVRSLEQLSYKDGTSQIDKKSGLDHMADALGYAVWAEFPIGQGIKNLEITGH